MSPRPLKKKMAMVTAGLKYAPEAVHIKDAAKGNEPTVSTNVALSTRTDGVQRLAAEEPDCHLAIQSLAKAQPLHSTTTLRFGGR